MKGEIHASTQISIAIGCAWFALLSHNGSVARSQQVEPSKDLEAPQAEAKRSALMHELFLKEIVEHEFYLDIELDRTCKSTLLPKRSRISATSRESAAFPSRHNRPVSSTRSR